MAYIDTTDLDPFAPDLDPVKAAAMIEDAVAQAVLVAPCLAEEGELTDHQKAAVKAVLRGAILRWNDSGSGALQREAAGPFSYELDTRQTRRSLFWPSEIDQLQKVCSAVTGGDSGAFTVDTVPSCAVEHSETCSIRFGAEYCSCGAILAGFALYGWRP